MKLSRYGFNVLVAIWLVPMLVLDVIGNTRTTGWESNVYYYKSIVDTMLLLISAYFIWVHPNAQQMKQEQEANDGDTVIGLGALAQVEYLYCLGLSLYAFFSWWLLHDINKASTGVVSLGSLVWSTVSLVVGLFSGIQFLRQKGAYLRDKAGQAKAKAIELAKDVSSKMLEK